MGSFTVFGLWILGNLPHYAVSGSIYLVFLCSKCEIYVHRIRVLTPIRFPLYSNVIGHTTSRSTACSSLNCSDVAAVVNTLVLHVIRHYFKGALVSARSRDAR